MLLFLFHTIMKSLSLSDSMQVKKNLMESNEAKHIGQNMSSVFVLLGFLYCILILKACKSVI